MGDDTATKAMLRRYLQTPREALIWKLEGLSEREARTPRTPTGTSLLGLVKHCLAVEIGYFGETMGRPWPTPAETPWEDADDPLADMWATPDESVASLTDLYRRVWVFADETIDALPLDAVGHVPWWPAERSEVTLGQVMVHVTADIARHAGHADILREQIDGAVGLRVDNTNIPGMTADDWAAYVARLQQVADDAR
ncbi:hypothetical protein GCM10025865_11990 [Paraoerskovia sediminicola]|uniref:DinB family protein n=1 Tax=Paraoerskovia sediminicola TaxID=1138587 RepID=A0ABN6XB39_9CELL|nr:DinB family protein [Paraoerskovia sediminicola]BDZ41900.1 hypothetical protein GCM10025865_11990 [Paraoerskovia sediminicola]